MQREPTVIDGDTVRWQGQTVRLVGFDTPETGNRARCASERNRGDKATARLRELIVSGNVTVDWFGAPARRNSWALKPVISGAPAVS